jgi:hypothetical protein
MKTEKTEVQAIDATPAPAVEVVARLDLLATEAGMLPEGLATGSPSNPVKQNPKLWIYRAICVRYRWNEHSLITKSDFDAAVKAVSHFSV